MIQKAIQEMVTKLIDNYINLIEPGKEIHLEDFLKIFNISIDSSREEDYTIDLINPENLSIELTDTKKNIKYKSKISDEIKLLKYNEGGIKTYVNLQIIGPTYTIQKDYNLGINNPIIEKLTITDGEYMLEFIKRFPLTSWFYSDNRIIFEIVYSIVENQADISGINRVLTKSYKECKTYDNTEISYDQLNNKSDYYIGEYTKQDKYIYTQDNSIVYVINEIRHSYYDNEAGLFIENTSKCKFCDFPKTMYEQDYPRLLDEDVKSAIILKGNNGCEEANYIELYKKDKKAEILYTVYKTESYNTKPSKECRTQEIPLLYEGAITSDETKIIIGSLKETYQNDYFINALVDELSIFGNLLDRRKTPQEELLSPKMYYDKSPEDIADIIKDKQEELFTLATKQFEILREKEKYTKPQLQKKDTNKN